MAALNLEIYDRETDSTRIRKLRAGSYAVISDKIGTILIDPIDRALSEDDLLYELPLSDATVSVRFSLGKGLDFTAGVKRCRVDSLSCYINWDGRRIFKIYRAI